MEYASYRQRIIALLIDMVIVAPIALVGREHGYQLLFTVADASYFIVLWYFKSATIGMIIVKIKLAPSDGRRLTLPRLVLRYLGFLLSFLFLGLGGLWMFTGDKRQTWQDKIAKTVVLKV